MPPLLTNPHESRSIKPTQPGKKTPNIKQAPFMYGLHRLLCSHSQCAKTGHSTVDGTTTNVKEVEMVSIARSFLRCCFSKLRLI